jgi:hypothetical protein
MMNADRARKIAILRRGDRNCPPEIAGLMFRSAAQAS